jgi:3-keto-disaccharide hydrolase
MMSAKAFCNPPASISETHSSLSDSPQPAIERNYEVQIDERGLDPKGNVNLLHAQFREWFRQMRKRFLTSDYAGWRMAGPGGFSRLPDGIVESYGGPGLFWYAHEVFEDFVLSVAWRITRPDDNSGVFLRFPPLSDSPQLAIERGYEVQIDDRGLDPKRNVFGSAFHLTGAIYQLAPAVRRCSRAAGEWNLFEITARGAMLAVKLNGQEVSILKNASREPRGHIGMQNHHNGSAVQFRDLYVMAL